jgi:hypothetical protein
MNTIIVSVFCIALAIGVHIVIAIDEKKQKKPESQKNQD